MELQRLIAQIAAIRFQRSASRLKCRNHRALAAKLNAAQDRVVQIANGLMTP